MGNYAHRVLLFRLTDATRLGQVLPTHQGVINTISSESNDCRMRHVVGTIAARLRHGHPLNLVLWARDREGGWLLQGVLIIRLSMCQASRETGRRMVTTTSVVLIVR